MTQREKRLVLVMQWLDENPNVSHYFAVKIPDVFKEIEIAIITNDNLYGSFVRYATKFLPRQYVSYIIEIKLRQWLSDNGSY